MTDDGKVKQIRKVEPAPALTDDQQELAAVVREMLDQVLAGTVVGFAGIAVTKDNEYLPNIGGEYDADAMIGSMWRCCRIIDDAAADAEDEDDDE